MRTAWLLLVTLACGCTADNPQYSAGAGPAVTDDGATAHGSTDLAARNDVLADLAPPPPPPPDLALRPPDLTTGGPGSPCKTACDCQAGLACVFGGCQKPFQGPIYCCESMNCPAGQSCQSGNGQNARCAGGGSDGGCGGPGYCQFIPCNNDGVCKPSGCGCCDIKAGHCA